MSCSESLLRYFDRYEVSSSRFDCSDPPAVAITIDQMRYYLTATSEEIENCCVCHAEG